MSQVTLYLPDELEQTLRRGARRAKKSLSAYVAELAGKRSKPAAWPKTFLRTFGSWKGAFPVPRDLPFEEREEL